MTKEQRGALGLGVILAGFNTLVPLVGHFIVSPFAIGEGGRWGLIAVSWLVASAVPPFLIFDKGTRPAATAAVVGVGVHAIVTLGALSF
ncbi:MAG: hypothetical protein GY913_07960 [Proteobacteria bacterium]|nr:hypothetical protein [Pseudomonadota bacterium]MCP4916847.1 hypothetical protein [Pseudomonadota bacterium]